MVLFLDPIETLFSLKEFQERKTRGHILKLLREKMSGFDVSAFDYGRKAAESANIKFAKASEFFGLGEPEFPIAPAPPIAAPPVHSPQPALQNLDSLFPCYGVVEIVGHVTVAGKISEASLVGKKFLRVDMPTASGGTFTRYVNPESIYQFTPTSPALAHEVGLEEGFKPHWAMGLNIEHPTGRIPTSSPPPPPQYEEEMVAIMDSEEEAYYEEDYH